MKILYILNTAKKVNNFSYTSMIAAQKVGLEFQIAGNWSYENDKEKREDEIKYGIKIHQVDFVRNPFDFKNIRAYRQVTEIIKKEKIEIIHCNTPIGGVVGRLAGKKCGIKKVIYQAHGFHFYKGAPKLNWIVYYPVEKYLAHFTDALITINTEDFNISRKFNLKKNGQKYYVPGVGINLKDFFDNAEIKIHKRRELGFPEDAIILISVGELNSNKNNKIIIEALKAINSLKLHYILCGEGNKRKELEENVLKYGLQKDVHFLGYRNDVKELYIASDIFVMSSYREGLSRSIMEAMASGLPGIVSNIRGNNDLIIDGKQGYLCMPNDVNEYISAISSLVEDEKTRFRMSQEVLEQIKHFKNDVVIQKYKEIYEEVIKK